MQGRSRVPASLPLDRWRQSVQSRRICTRPGLSGGEGCREREGTLCCFYCRMDSGQSFLFTSMLSNNKNSLSAPAAARVFIFK